jgi:UDP:flavonoid glycosyltransferase YjiC (YdhE family)
MAHLDKQLHILFFAESATLAHVVRASSLASSAINVGHRVSFATEASMDSWFLPQDCYRHDLASITPDQFLKALRKGSWPYDHERLSRYIKADIALIEQLQPDIVVSDMRLSLPISARMVRVPLLTIANAYWSPSVHHDTWPLPSTGPLKSLPYGLANWLFKKVFPINLKRYLGYHNALRRAAHLKEYQTFLHAFCDGDITAYSDPEELFSDYTSTLDSELFLGPVGWSPTIPLPELPIDERPLIYVSLGSSGKGTNLNDIVTSLIKSNFRVIVSTGFGKPLPLDDGSIVQAPFLNGAATCEVADLVVCNGGSPTAYQALAAGKPVIGIPENLDQYLCMTRLLAARAAVQVRAEQVTQTNFGDLAFSCLADNDLQKAARSLRDTLTGYSPSQTFLSAVNDLVANGHSDQSNRNRQNRGVTETPSQNASSPATFSIPYHLARLYFAGGRQ